MKWNKLVVILMFGVVLFLAACGNSPETQIYNHLEAAVELEDGFQQQQDDITELERKEQEIYKEIIDLGIEEIDQIKQLADEAIVSIGEREDKINLEKESLDASREEFERATEFIKEIKDEKVKEQAELMYDAMMERFNAYETFHSKYKESLELERSLYEMIKQDDLDQEAFQAHIEKVNLMYQEVINANNTFNEYTSEYNEMKKDFYQIAEINVKYVN